MLSLLDIRGSSSRIGGPIYDVKTGGLGVPHVYHLNTLLRIIINLKHMPGPYTMQMITIHNSNIYPAQHFK